MKIISRGVDPKTIPLLGTCSTCKTSVEFLRSEATYYAAHVQREQEYWCVVCPVCNGSISGYAKCGSDSHMDR